MWINTYAAAITAAFLGGQVCHGGDSGWQHGWDTPADSWWGYGGLNLSPLTEQEVSFIAKTYPITAISFCPGPQNATTQAGILAAAKELKAANPDIKILQYFNVDQFACYKPTDPTYATFLAHPEWQLKDDFGNFLQPPRIDPTNADAAAFWTSVPLSVAGSEKYIDGVLADGGAIYTSAYHLKNFSAARLAALDQAQFNMIASLQEKFTAANGGKVIANGMTGGPVNPADPFNLKALNYVDGIENEHYGVFEQVLRPSGALDKDKVCV